MSFSDLPLSYCTNVHPARTLVDVLAGLDRFSLPIRIESGGDLAVGLWLARSVMDELATAASRQQFAQELRDRSLTCYTLNAFPFGDFHSERVKEQVYLPDWTCVSRLQYTLDCARLLADLLPASVSGSISTVPLGFKQLATSPDFQDRCADQLIAAAVGLHQLQEETGKTIRLAIEPEPLCVLETTAETLAFFERLRSRASSPKDRQAIDQYLGVCYDVCHQSVEFEDVVASIAALTAADIRINKVHISCAIEANGVNTSPAVRTALAQYIEPRYLHQTIARKADGTVVKWLDLDAVLLEQTPAEFAHADVWRVHFHVPVDAERLGPLGTTRPDLERALAAVYAMPYAPHLEVETYTWEVLPQGGRPEVVAGFARELIATRALLKTIAQRS